MKWPEGGLTAEAGSGSRAGWTWRARSGGNLQSATTTRELLRRVLNCSFDDMLMTDMVGGCGGEVSRWGEVGVWVLLICHHRGRVNITGRNGQRRGRE